MSVPDHAGVVPHRLLRTVAMAAACGLCLLAAASCRRSTTSTGSGVGRKEECGTILDSAVGMAQPLKLGLTTSIDAVANRLNDWRRTCPEAKKIPASLDDEAKTLLSAVLTKKELAAMQSDTFDELDARHVRNSLVFVRIANTATIASQSDVDQVVDLFYHVVRNIELVERKPGAAPRPVFRAMLFGRGTAADRAWVFAAILRQLKISAVVVSPARAPAAKQAASSPYLVGVLLNGKIYLFDMQLGLPVPAADDDPSNPLIRTPATLAQFVADPKIARSLSTGDFKYPLAAGDLKNPRVQLIGHRSLWSPRMKRLYATGQVRSPARNGDVIGRLKVELFVELGGSQGLIARVVEFGQGLIARNAISIWPYPYRQITAFARMNEAQRSEMANLERPFEVPREPIIDKETGRVAVDKNGRPLLGPQSRLQLKARIRQMMGDYDKAVTTYLSVQSQVRRTEKTHPELPRDVMDAADRDADFWIGQCKFELSDLNIAVGRFTKQKTSRKWSVQAGFLLALCYVKQNKPAAARSELDALIKLHAPQAHGFALLWNRWKSLGKTAPPAKKPPVAVPQKKAAEKPPAKKSSN
jgi:uncharacterized ferredoxin-like protein